MEITSRIRALKQTNDLLYRAKRLIEFATKTTYHESNAGNIDADIIIMQNKIGMIIEEFGMDDECGISVE